MTTAAWLLLVAVLILDSGSHLLLKAASMRSRAHSGPAFVRALIADPRVWLAVAAFVGLFLAWIGFISLVPLSQGVMVGSITIVGVMVGARIFFDERITPERAVALGLIAIGVLLVGLGAR